MVHQQLGRYAARDEREAGIDLAADRLAYLVLSYGLLVAVAYRAFAWQQSSWDLLALVVLGGVVGLGYRAWHRALSGRWATVVGLSIAAAAIVAVAILALMRAI
ncbi:MAG: hypothetical protein ACAH65_02830 [Chloroflexota bacterium]